ncbi:MAG TPA: AbrB family transcriptional regulator [Magnetospirillaceae bacterium]
MNKNLFYWAGLLVASLALSYGLHAVHVPASYLIGPMVVAIGFGARGAPIKLPPIAFTAAQAIIGCLVARTLSASILTSLASDWAPMLLSVAATVSSGALAGWLLMRFAGLPGSTAAWGSTPGAASVMVAMAADFGADPRLVAFIQYLRVVIVVLSISLGSHLIFGVTGAAPGAGAPPTPEGLDLALPLIETLAIAGFGAFVGLRLKIPAGALLVPMVLAAAFNISKIVTITLPPWLLGATYLVVGWYIGLGFTRDVFVYALRVLPKVLMSSVVLIALCGLASWILTLLLPIDGLTAYLATSPGGLDSVVIIAVGSHADAPFVIAAQTLRLFAVMGTGPFIAKLLSRTK